MLAEPLIALVVTRRMEQWLVGLSTEGTGSSLTSVGDLEQGLYSQLLTVVNVLSYGCLCSS